VRIAILTEDELEKIINEAARVAVYELMAAMMKHEPDEMLSLGRVAAMLDVHVATVRRWIREGRLPARRIGRRLFVARRDLIRSAHRLKRQEDDHDQDAATGSRGASCATRR